jgi:short-subunit dehydrogenase
MKKIFITGASSGLGSAIANAYAEQYAIQGICIGLVGRNLIALKKLAETLHTHFQARCLVYALDVRQAPKLKAAAQDFIANYGAPNIVIACAGVSRGTLTENQEDIPAFQAIMDINVMGIVNTFQPFIDAMQNNHNEQKQLVGIASVAGIRGLPGAGAYSASKSAVITYLESLRLEMQKHHIQVTTIAPGYIRSPMTDINTYRMPFLMDADVFAKKCIRAIERQTRYTVIPWQMAVLSRLLRFIPPILWDWIMRNAPHKERTKWDWLNK